MATLLDSEYCLGIISKYFQPSVTNVKILFKLLILLAKLYSYADAAKAKFNYQSANANTIY